METVSKVENNNWFVRNENYCPSIQTYWSENSGISNLIIDKKKMISVVNFDVVHQIPFLLFKKLHLICEEKKFALRSFKVSWWSRACWGFILKLIIHKLIYAKFISSVKIRFFSLVSISIGVRMVSCSV